METVEPGAADVQAHLGVPDLGALGAGYGGSVALDAQINTTDSTTRLRLDGQVVDIALADLPAAQIVGGIFTGTNRLQADVVMADGVTQIAQADLTGPRVALRAEGS